MFPELFYNSLMGKMGQVEKDVSQIYHSDEKGWSQDLGPPLSVWSPDGKGKSRSSTYMVDFRAKMTTHIKVLGQVAKVPYMGGHSQPEMTTPVDPFIGVAKTHDFGNPYRSEAVRTPIDL